MESPIIFEQGSQVNEARRNLEKQIRSALKRVWKNARRRWEKAIGRRRPASQEKTLQSYFQDLTQFAARSNPNGLKLGDEYLWPYFRQRLWVQIYGIGQGKPDKAEMPLEIMQRGRSVDLPLKIREGLKTEYKAWDIAEIQPGAHKVDFLFLVVTNAAEQVLLPDGKYYHRITDPFYEIAGQVGRAMKIEMLKARSPHLEKSRDYHHKVQYILPPIPTKLDGEFNMEYPVGFLTKLNRKMTYLHYTHPELRKFLRWDIYTRSYYMDLLQRLRPRFVLLNGYHFQAPLISAAHALGIKTIDIQHGIQVGYNPLYNDWSEMPPEGYQAVVDRFFVWGEKEADSIKKVFKGAKHQPIVTGFPWLNRQRELTIPLDEAYKEKFARYRFKSLLILQNQSTIPQIYKDLIQQSSQDHLWIIRHHPKGRRFTLEDVGHVPHDNVLLDPYFDQIALAQLFKHADIAVSEGSTVAIEADHAGLYNFVFGDKGYENYKQEVDAGAFFHFKKASGFFSKAAKLDLSARKSRTDAYANADIKAIFQDLLK